MQRIRITYCKGDSLIYSGSLDIHKVWERTFRRAGISLAYSHGFHPQPKIHQALPLPLGFYGNSELLDFWSEGEVSVPVILQKLNPALQPGLTILKCVEVPLSDPPLQTLVKSATFEVILPKSYSLEEIEKSITRIKSNESQIRERRGKTYDLRPLILFIGISKNDPLSILMNLKPVPGETGRPEEVLDALGIPFELTDITRTQTNFE
jgi:radical SAM-linked protein